MEDYNELKNQIISNSGLGQCLSRVERLANCIQISNLINSELSIGRLLNNIMKTTKKAFNADAVSLLLKDDVSGDLLFQIALGDVGDDIKEMYRLKKDEGIAGHVARTGIPLNEKDVYNNPKFSKNYDRQTKYRTKSMLCVPLQARGETIGVIQIINKLIHPFFFSGEELEMLTIISSSAAVAIDTAKMHKFILQRETLERDLCLAKEVQESFLPVEVPEVSGFAFGALNQPALEIGGDFYNFFELPDEKLGIVLGDVSGKGISASLFMAKLTSDLQYYALLYREPGELLSKINNLLCKRAKRGMFVTLVYILLNTQTKQILFANGGHLSPIYVDKDDIIQLGQESAKGPPLGIIPDVEFMQEEFELKKGGSVTLYTDGIIEAKNIIGELYGIERLLSVIKTLSNTPDTLISGIINSVDKFVESEGPSDDLTLLSFRSK